MSFMQWGWFVTIIVIFVVAFVTHWLISKLFNHLFVVEHLKKKHYVQIWLNALYRPIQVFIWVLASCYVAQVSGIHLLAQKWIELPIDLGIIEKVISIVFLLWVALRFVNQFEYQVLKQMLHEHRRIDKTSLHALSQLIRVTVIVVCILMIMQTVGISIASLLAFGGISSLAVGFAAKDTLANFLGGMMIYTDRPFHVGDAIRSTESNIEGTVEHIGWRLTRIRTVERRALYVPNSLFSTICIENVTRMTHRRIYQTIGLRYEDIEKVSAITAAVKLMLEMHPAIDATETLIVNLEALADSSLNFFIYAFTKTTDRVEFQAVQQDVLLKVMGIIASHGAECAFPTRTVFLEKTADSSMEKIK